MKRIRKILFYLLTVSVLFASSGFASLCICDRLMSHAEMADKDCCCKPVKETESCCSKENQNHPSEEDRSVKICPGKYFAAKKENNSLIVKTFVANLKLDFEKIDLIKSEETIRINKVPKFLKFLQIKNFTLNSGKGILIVINQLKIPDPYLV